MTRYGFTRDPFRIIRASFLMPIQDLSGSFVDPFRVLGQRSEPVCNVRIRKVLRTYIRASPSRSRLREARLPDGQKCLYSAVVQPQKGGST